MQWDLLLYLYLNQLCFPQGTVNIHLWSDCWYIIYFLHLHVRTYDPLMIFLGVVAKPLVFCSWQTSILIVVSYRIVYYIELYSGTINFWLHRYNYFDRSTLYCLSFQIKVSMSQLVCSCLIYSISWLIAELANICYVP